MTNQIDDDKFYHLTEVIRDRLVPFWRNYNTANRMMWEDKAKRASERTLNAKVIGEGRGRIILIKGVNLKKFIEYETTNRAK